VYGLNPDRTVLHPPNCPGSASRWIQVPTQLPPKSDSLTALTIAFTIIIVIPLRTISEDIVLLAIQLFKAAIQFHLILEDI